MQKKINLKIQVLAEALLLLAVTLGIVAYFSHRALQREAIRNAEQTLQGTIQNIDNILLSVEQATGNVYYDLIRHLDDPDRMYTYSRQLVECNPNIVGCAICFKPGYYPGRDLFMAYIHRKSSAPEDRTTLVTSETFTDRPYTEQVWYAEPMRTGNVGWIDPLKGSDTEEEPLVTYCLPFDDKNGERVGVIAVDMSIHQLSQIILSAKPSENGYCVLLAHNGSYIVHPDKEKLTNPMVFSQKERNVDPTEIEAAKVMLAGESGMKEFHRRNGDWCVFYKPFERAEWTGKPSGNFGWSVGVVYPKEDIFGKHNILLWRVLAIAVGSLLLFFLLCSWIIRRQLKPVAQLARSAHHIAEGNFNEQLPYTDRQDEIGLLQNQFEQMQHSLQKQVDQLKEDTAQLRQQGHMLRADYDKAVETDEMKTSFLRYMTEQMTVSTECIDKSATKLCNDYTHLSKKEIDQQADNIQQKSQTILEMLKHVAHFAGTDTRKETSHE